MQHFCQFYKSIFFIILIISLVSCATDDAINLPEISNKNIPEDNGLINFEKEFGNNTDNNFFYKSALSDNGDSYVISNLNESQASSSVSIDVGKFTDYYNATLSRFDQEGSLIWEAKPGFSIFDIAIIKDNKKQKDLILLIGYDENGMNSNFRSRIMVYDESGNFLSNVSNLFGLYMFDLKKIDQNEEYIKVIGVQYTKSPGLKEYCSSLFEFRINTTNYTIYGLIPTHYIENQWKGVQFFNLTIHNGNYLLGGKIEDETSSSSELHFIVLNSVNFQVIEEHILKDTQLDGTSLNTTKFNDIFVYDDNIYITGSFKDNSRDGYYSSIIFCFSGLNYQLLWKKSYAISSSGDDGFFSLRGEGDFLYATGSSSLTTCSSCEEKYLLGNAWIAKINPKTGQLVSSRTFGNENYFTVFWSFETINDNFIGFGAKQKNPVSIHNRKAWLVKLPLGSI